MPSLTRTLLFVAAAVVASTSAPAAVLVSASPSSGRSRPSSSPQTNGEGALVSSCASQPPCPYFEPTSWSTYSFSGLLNTIRHPMKCGARSHYDMTNAEHRREMSKRLSDLLSQVVGQDHVIKPVKSQVNAKLVNPLKPLVFLFTGDNGVGKTMTANLISLAMSLRCESATECLTGDNALSITATESNVEARESLVRRIANHAYKHPNGVVIINEVLLLEPRVAEYLAPLFGRGAGFHDHRDVRLNGLTVILTSDFGKHVAVTKGKSSAEIAALSREAFSKRFGLTFAADMSSHAFLPLSYENALLACKRFILNLPCRNMQVSSVSIDGDLVADLIVGQLIGNSRLAENNAREITKSVESLIDGPVAIKLMEEFPVGAQVEVKVEAHTDSALRVIVQSRQLEIRAEEIAEL